MSTGNLWHFPAERQQDENLYSVESVSNVLQSIAVFFGCVLWTS